MNQSPKVASEQPLVSLCIPAYNYERYVEQAVLSLADQDYPNLEILILNNASTDRTGSICEHLAQSDPRMRVVHHETTTPPSESHNKLLTLARGDFVAMASADDLFYSHKITSQVRHLQQNSAWGACFSLVDFIDAESKIVAGLAPTFTVYKRPERIRADLVLGEGVCMPSNLIRREVIERIGLFDGSFYRAFDYEYWLRIVQSYDIGLVPQALMAYRLHGKNANDYDRSRIQRDAWKAIALHGNKIVELYPEADPGAGKIEDTIAALAINTRDWPDVEKFLWQKMKAVGRIDQMDAKRMIYALLQQKRGGEAKAFLHQAAAFNRSRSQLPGRI